MRVFKQNNNLPNVGDIDGRTPVPETKQRRKIIWHKFVEVYNCILTSAEKLGQHKKKFPIGVLTKRYVN